VTFLIEIEVSCPWCGEHYPTTIDTSQGDHTTIEDCAVCCRPIELTVACEPGEVNTVEAARG
jgi:Cysteine-rich CPXCG